MGTNGLNGHGSGHLPGSPAAPPQGPPEGVTDLAASCVRFVRARYGVELDFSPDTLSLLDQYVRDARQGETDKAETLELLTAVTGAYFGEVVRLTFGGEWKAEGESEDWRICLEPVYLAFNPLGTMREALKGAEQPGWHAHFAMEEEDRAYVEERIAALGEVDEDEFFLPTTRWDVLEISIEALQSRMGARGETGVRFSREDY